MNFNIGDTVRLKSGGPLMTVEQIGRRAYSEDEAVWCIWFEQDGHRQLVQRDTFPPQSLEKAEE